MVAWWTGGAWVLYFADAPTLVKELATFQAPLVAYVWIGILTFTTYALAGHMREQVCLYMCPWPRIQAALTDEHALNVTYRYDRGEPRGSVKKNAALRAGGQARRRLHRLLPMRLRLPDRRRHPQRAQSRLHPVRALHRRLRCGDGEDRPAGAADRLRYRPQHQAPAGGPDRRPINIVRMRTALYAAIIALVGAVMLYTLATRRSEAISVIHDRNPMFVRLSDGELRNGFTVRILNKALETRSFVLTVDGLTDIDLKVVGDTVTSGRTVVVAVGPDQTHELRALVGTYQTLPPAASIPLTFRITDPEDRAAGHGRRPFPRAMRSAMMPTHGSIRRETSAARRELTGRMVLICLVAFFAIVAGVNAVMIRAAVSTFGGVETAECLSGRPRFRARYRRSPGAGCAALAGAGQGCRRRRCDAGGGDRRAMRPAGRSLACGRPRCSPIRPTGAPTTSSRSTRMHRGRSWDGRPRLPASGRSSSSCRAAGAACSAPRTASSCAEGMRCRRRSIFRSTSSTMAATRTWSSRWRASAAPDASARSRAA